MRQLKFLMLMAGLFLIFSCNDNHDEPNVTSYTEDFSIPQSNISGKLFFDKSDNDRVYLKKISFNGDITELSEITKVNLNVKANNNNPNGSPSNEPTFNYVYTPTTSAINLNLNLLDVKPELFVGRNEFQMQKLTLQFSIEKQQGSPTILNYIKNY